LSVVSDDSGGLDVPVSRYACRERALPDATLRVFFLLADVARAVLVGEPAFSVFRYIFRVTDAFSQMPRSSFSCDVAMAFGNRRLLGFSSPELKASPDEPSDVLTALLTRVFRFSGFSLSATAGLETPRGSLPESCQL